jgi:hypothetical protein
MSAQEMIEKQDIVDRLHGPVQWGYMCLADGGFIQDDAPVEAAAEITTLKAKLEEKEKQLRLTDEAYVLADQGRERFFNEVTALKAKLAEAVEGLTQIEKAGVGAASDWSDAKCADYWSGLALGYRRTARTLLTTLQSKAASPTEDAQ